MSKQSNVFPVNPDPVVILRNARTIYIRKKSVYFKASELENALRKKAEFQQLGLLITRDEENADLHANLQPFVEAARYHGEPADRSTSSAGLRRLTADLWYIPSSALVANPACSHRDRPSAHVPLPRSVP